MNKYTFLLLTLLVAFNCFTLPLPAVPAAQQYFSAETTDISDNYYDVIHREIQQAKKSIYMAMFVIRIYRYNQDNPAYKLIEDLIAAHRRGVKITVYLDHSYSYSPAKKRSYPDPKNDLAYNLLSLAGVDVKFIVPEKTVHSKLIIIDDSKVISGSTNWTRHALSENFEDTNLIESADYAKIKLARIIELEKLAEPQSWHRAETIKLPVYNMFIKDKDLAPEMLTRHDHRVFDLYLLLLKAQNDQGSSSLTINYETLAAELDIKKKKDRIGYRREISRALRKLQNEYKLITAEFKFDGPAEITLLDYMNKEQHYSSPTKAYFNIPYSYWEYDWSNKLSQTAKFCYFICLYKTGTSKTKPWWSLPLLMLAQDYHIHADTISTGLNELERNNLLIVKRTWVKDGAFEDRPANQYLLKRLPSEQEIQDKWLYLEELYGKKDLKQAKSLALLLEKENKYNDVEKIVLLIKEYGFKKVKKAIKITAELREDNPSRNIDYAGGILNRWEKETKK